MGYLLHWLLGCRARRCSGSGLLGKASALVRQPLSELQLQSCWVPVTTTFPILSGVWITNVLGYLKYKLQLQDRRHHLKTVQVVENSRIRGIVPWNVKMVFYYAQKKKRRKEGRANEVQRMTIYWASDRSQVHLHIYPCLIYQLEIRDLAVVMQLVTMAS